MKHLTINLKAMAIYLFIMVFLFLAGMTIGSHLLFIFYAFLFFPLLFFVEFIFLCLNIKSSQNFSNEHPLKGDIINYRLVISNDSSFRCTRVKISFAMTFPVSGENFQDKELNLDPGETWTHEISIRCEYRGIYQVGIKQITVSDSLGWIQFHQREWHRTFYVYPRIIILPSLAFNARDENRISETPTGTREDYSLLKSLAPYREGESIKNIYWKKFALYNQPVLKDYHKSSLRAIDIYFDLRRNEPVSTSVLKREDCAVETAVALVHYYLIKGIPLCFHAIGRTRYDFNSYEVNDFTAFHKHTIQFYFGPYLSASECFELDNQMSPNKGVTNLFITHSIDSTLFDLANKNRRSGNQLILILITAGFDTEDKAKEISKLQTLRQNGVFAYVVHDSESMIEDLKK